MQTPNWITIKKDLVLKAYDTGRSRGTSLALGYYVSADNTSIFCNNPNSPQGVTVTLGDNSGSSEEIEIEVLKPTATNNPDNLRHFDMSKALAVAHDW